MEIRNDELIIWKDKAHMVVNGPAAIGEFLVTNKRLAFIVNSEPTIFSRSVRSDIWDLSIERVMDVDTYDLKGLPYPVIRIRYSEDDAYFTFPDSSPRSSLAAMRLFINAARRIEGQLDVMKGVSLSLKEDTLLSGGTIPELIKDVPRPADQVCYQCGKGLVDPEVEDPGDTTTCTVCEGSYR